ncbi:MAG: hypothetical protein RI983_153 [Bacteroidota bacterium]
MHQMRHGFKRSQACTQQALINQLPAADNSNRELFKKKKMKKYIICLMALLMVCITTIAQLTNNKTATDTAYTTVQFRVEGACEMCKERIEETAKGKGVQKAEWDVDSKILTLHYFPAIANVNKIKDRIVEAGHDLLNKKAKNNVYNALPECCHYRDQDKKAHEAENINTDEVRGIVLEADKKGQFNPLFQASVKWLNTERGVLTDSLGYFSIPLNNASNRLIISYIGYRADTFTVENPSTLKVILADDQALHNVTVTNTRRSSYISTISPIRSEIMTAKELLKAACCNLSESFETNPSVDVSYNDAVTGSKQIQLLGLSGNYTQLTVENLPGPRGLATPLGLNSIAGPWIESIQLTKGVGSVANGFESIAGQINVELKKPGIGERLLANMYINEFGKTDLNLNLQTQLSSKWSAGLLLHDNFLNNANIDFNKDGFRDLPTGNQFSVVNRYQYNDSKGWMAQFGFKVMKDNKTGGQTNFDPKRHQNSNSIYGLGINTSRYEGFAKIGYVFPQKVYKSIGLQIATIRHDQDSYFGKTIYTAKQNSFYSNLIYQSIIGNTNHKFRTGMSLQHDTYDEVFNVNPYKRTETVSGAFFEYTYTPTEKFSVVAGIRGDYNSLFGAFATPRLHIRYEPVKGSIFRFSAGRGQRTANIFAENTGILVSARQLNIIGGVAGKAYGLDPEIAWNRGISFDQSFRLFNRKASLAIDFYRNDFTNQVVTDLETTNEIRFYNLKGKSYSNSFQAEISMEPISQLELKMAYRFFDVKTTYGNDLLQRPFVSQHRAFLSLDYTTENNWKFNYTITYNGQKRIPSTASNPIAFQRETQSPDFYLMAAQISKTVGKNKHMDFYVGAENLTNFFQQGVIVSAANPFSPYFDASLVWGPINGRMLYAGWRMRLK